MVHRKWNDASIDVKINLPMVHRKWNDASIGVKINIISVIVTYAWYVGFRTGSKETERN
jgi:hypothetical protein